MTNDPKKELCEQYKDARTFLEDMIPVIEKDLPDGKQLASELRALMAIADLACAFE